MYLFPGEVMALGCTVESRQAGGGMVMLWAMFYRESLSLGIHVDVSLIPATYLNILADQVRYFKAVIFPDGSALFQQDNATLHTLFRNGLRSITKTSGVPN